MLALKSDVVRVRMDLNEINAGKNLHFRVWYLFLGELVNLGAESHSSVTRGKPQRKGWSEMGFDYPVFTGYRTASSISRASNVLQSIPKVTGAFEGLNLGSSWNQIWKSQPRAETFGVLVVPGVVIHGKTSSFGDPMRMQILTFLVNITLCVWVESWAPVESVPPMAGAGMRWFLKSLPTLTLPRFCVQSLIPLTCFFRTWQLVSD